MTQSTPGQRWEEGEEEETLCSAQTTARELASFLVLFAVLGTIPSSVYFTPAPMQRVYLNSALVLSSGLTTLKAEVIYLSREQALLPY